MLKPGNVQSVSFKSKESVLGDGITTVQEEFRQVSRPRTDIAVDFLDGTRRSNPAAEATLPAHGEQCTRTQRRSNVQCRLGKHADNEQCQFAPQAGACLSNVLSVLKILAPGGLGSLAGLDDVGQKQVCVCCESD